MSFFESFNQFITSAAEEIQAATADLQAALDQTGVEIAEGWDRFVEDVNLALDETEESKQADFGVAAENWQQNLEKIWHQQPGQLPIHIDLPRLISKIKVHENGAVVWSCPEENPSVAVFSLFRFLAEKLNDTNFPPISPEQEEKCCQAEQFLVPYLESFFGPVDTDTSSTVRLLKAMNQKLLFPAYYHIKHFLKSVQMNDKPNTWTIDVIFEPGTVTVCHRKIQIIPSWAFEPTKTTLEEAASFKWELKLSFDPTVSQPTEVACNIISGKVDETLLPKEHYEYFRSVVPELVD